MAKKRGQNEGSIFKRKDGRWAAVVSVGYRDGKRARKTFYGKTRTAVREQLTVALRSHQQGIAINQDERETVSAFLDRWLTETAKPKVRASTFASYKKLVDHHLKPALGHVRLLRLSPSEVQAFLNAKLEAGLSPRTVQYLLVLLRSGLKQALRWGLVSRNVATLVDAPRVVREEVRPLNPIQAKKLLAALRGDRLEALYAVALAMGLRKGEALGLRWQDVDLKSGTLTVRCALQRIEKQFEFVEPKSSRSRRTIALPGVASTTLAAHRVRQRKERLVAGSRWVNLDLVFCSTWGTPLDERTVSKHFKKKLAHAGLPSIRFHDLRHTCASLLLAQGVHPRVVMETLGHSQIALTMNTYSHVMPEGQREAARSIDAVLGRNR